MEVIQTYIYKNIRKFSENSWNVKIFTVSYRQSVCKKKRPGHWDTELHLYSSPPLAIDLK